MFSQIRKTIFTVGCVGLANIEIAQAEDWIDCSNKHTDISLVGCTALLVKEDFKTLQKWEILFKWGQAYAKAENYERAIADYTESADQLTNENNVTVALEKSTILIERAKAKERKKDLAGAQDDYKKAAKISPTNSDALFELGHFYYGNKNLKEAIDILTAAIAIDNKSAGIFDVRGNAYDDLGQSALAIADYNRAIEINPLGDALFFDRGIYYEHRGDKAKALADFKMAVFLNPNYTAAMKAMKRVE